MSTTEERDRRIYLDFADGRATVVQLAQRFGLSPGYVSRIIAEQKHAEGAGGPDPARSPGRHPATAPASRAVALHEVPADLALEQVPQHVRDAYIPQGALDLIRRGVPENTWLAYRKQLILFGDWCGEQKRTAAPVTEATMLAYLDYLRSLPMPGTMDRRDENGVRRRFRPAPSTIGIWHAAVKFIHGIGTPPIPWEPAKKLSLAMGGYEIEMQELGWQPKSAPRAYPDDVRAMVRRCDRDTPNGKRDAAILLNGWNLASRAADLANYRIRDVRRTPQGVDWTLTKSKTLKPGQTRTTAVRANTEHPEFCPVIALFEWLEWLASQKEADPTWAIFRPIDRYGKRVRMSSRGPAYRMSSTSVTEVVQKYALLAGLGDDYTMHSLRRGFATWLRELGWDVLAIARAYGWSPGGSINVYMEEADRWSPQAPGAGAFL